MIRQIAAAFALALQVFATAAMAADNAVILTPGVGVTMRTKDIGGGVQSSVVILGDTSGNPLTTVPISAGSGVAVDGWDATQGAIGDAAATVGGTGTVSAKLRQISTQLGTLNTNVTAPLPALAATAFNTCSYTTGVTNPVCMDLNGNLYVNFGRNNGTAGTASASVLTVQGIASMTPFLVNPGTSTLWNASWAGGTLGAMANYGTSPGAVLVPGVNAFVTNTVTNAPATCTETTPVVPTASDNHAVLKNGAGTACSVHFSNNSATKNYARLYDAGTGFNGCNSATGVLFAFEIPPSDSGFSISLGGGNGIAFSTGLSWCITSGFGLTDTTNATATAIYANASYK